MAHSLFFSEVSENLFYQQIQHGFEGVGQVDLVYPVLVGHFLAQPLL